MRKELLFPDQTELFLLKQLGSKSFGRTVQKKQTKEFILPDPLIAHMLSMNSGRGVYCSDNEKSEKGNRTIYSYWDNGDLEKKRISDRLLIIYLIGNYQEFANPLNFSEIRYLKYSISNRYYEKSKILFRK